MGEYGKVEKQTRQVESDRWQANIVKAKTVLGWRSKYSLRKGLEKTITWFTQNLHLYA